MTGGTLHLGLCLPKSCTNDHIHILLQEIFSLTETEHDPKPDVLRVKNLELNSKFLLKKSVILLLTVFLVIKFLNRLAVKLEKNEKNLEHNQTALGLQNNTEKSAFWKIVQCFNLSKINDKSNRTSIPSISGLKWVFCGFLRKLSMIWISGHLHATWWWLATFTYSQSLHCLTKSVFLTKVTHFWDF